MRKIVKAFLYSLNGLKVLLHERAFVEELLLFPIVIDVVLSIENTSYRLYIAFSYILVLICEAFNTCIEKTVNRISTDVHPLSKEIKDISSSAVFIAIINLTIAMIIGIF